MSKLYIMRGLPASGKSTKAKEILEHGGTVRVNKDLLRTMLHFDKFTGKNEDLTSQAEREIAAEAFRRELNVVVDDTNLNPRVLDSWKAFANIWDASVDIIDMHTGVGECIARDIAREKPVGKDVIIKMALQYQDFLKGETFILCDLDGTLCDIKHRLKYAKGEEKDWDKFFAEVPDDTLREDVWKQVCDASAEHLARVIFVSARPERCRKDTEEWFLKHGISGHYMLFMRPNHDKREDTIVKREMYDKYLKNLDVVKVFDDRPTVIRMWKELGLDVVDVGEGVEF